MSPAPKTYPPPGVELLNSSLGRREKSDAGTAGFLPVPTDATFFHLTHWKAASQWLRMIITDLYGPATVAPEHLEMQLLSRPILSGKIYLCAYLSKQEFDLLSMPGRCRRIVLIRDLRDTMISFYFSLRYSHEFDPVQMPWMTKWRIILSRLNEEDGMMYFLERGLCACADIQRSWLESGEKNVFRLEDCIADACGTLGQMFDSGWGLPVETRHLQDVVSRYSFEKLSGGRERGEEDTKSHYRKGVHGDWRNHFTPAITRRFKALFSDVLIMGGYEEDANW